MRASLLNSHTSTKHNHKKNNNIKHNSHKTNNNTKYSNALSVYRCRDIAINVLTQFAPLIYSFDVVLRVSVCVRCVYLLFCFWFIIIFVVVVIVVHLLDLSLFSI